MFGSGTFVSVLPNCGSAESAWHCRCSVGGEGDGSFHGLGDHSPSRRPFRHRLPCWGSFAASGSCREAEGNVGQQPPKHKFVCNLDTVQEEVFREMRSETGCTPLREGGSSFKSWLLGTKESGRVLEAAFGVYGTLCHS